MSVDQSYANLRRARMGANKRFILAGGMLLSRKLREVIFEAEGTIVRSIVSSATMCVASMLSRSGCTINAMMKSRQTIDAFPGV